MYLGDEDQVTVILVFLGPGLQQVFDKCLLNTQMDR